MQWVWFGNLVLVILTLFGVGRIITKDNAIQTFEGKVGISQGVAEQLVEQLSVEALQQIEEAGTLAGANLEGITLKFVDLTDLYLVGIRFRGANLVGSDFTMSNLSNADLRDTNLQGAYFANVQLADARLQNANLHDSYLSYADLTRASLWGAQVQTADLTNASLGNAYLIDTSFQGSNLSNADLRSAWLFETDFTDAILDGAYLGETWHSPGTTFPVGFNIYDHSVSAMDWNSDGFYEYGLRREIEDYLAGAGSSDEVLSWLHAVPGWVTDRYITDYDLPWEIVERVQ